MKRPSLLSSSAVTSIEAKVNRRAKRQLWICTVLGLLTTVAVAWTLALRTWTGFSMVWGQLPATKLAADGTGDVLQTWVFGIDQRRGVWACLSWTMETEARVSPSGSVTLGRSTGVVKNVWHPVTGVGARPPHWSIPRRRADARNPVDGVRFYHELAAGWPLPALGWTRANTHEPGKTSQRLFGGFSLPGWLAKACRSETVPIRPIWRGLVVDAVVYGLAWFVLLFGFGNVRRLLRSRVGHCPKCGYDLRGDLKRGCPECGWERLCTQS
ncbi:MAG: hypothetical protein L0219_14405 [Phycisphaerales bacterium]|nr:hypothetical protein [Phycisphaerales bacterium]